MIEAIWIWIGSTIITMTVAKAKGQEGPLWFVLAFFFPVLAVIGIAGMPNIRKPGTRV